MRKTKVMPVAAAYGVTTTKGPRRSKHYDKELFYVVKDDGSGGEDNVVLKIFQVQPGLTYDETANSVSGFSESLSNQSKTFEEYNISSLFLDYAPSCGTETGGKIMIAYDPNPWNGYQGSVLDHAKTEKQISRMVGTYEIVPWKKERIELHTHSLWTSGDKYIRDTIKVDGDIGRCDNGVIYVCYVGPGSGSNRLGSLTYRINYTTFGTRPVRKPPSDPPGFRLASLTPIASINPQPDKLLVRIDYTPGSSSTKENTLFYMDQNIPIAAIVDNIGIKQYSSTILTMEEAVYDLLHQGQASYTLGESETRQLDLTRLLASDFINCFWELQPTGSLDSAVFIPSYEGFIRWEDEHGDPVFGGENQFMQLSLHARIQVRVNCGFTKQGSPVQSDYYDLSVKNYHNFFPGAMLLYAAPPLKASRTTIEQSIKELNDRFDALKVMVSESPPEGLAKVPA